MNRIGTYHNRTVFWANYDDILFHKMPKNNWICFITCSKKKPSIDVFETFIRNAIQHGILEFKGHGAYGELLHDWFDETINIMEAMENNSEIDVMTTWHNNESYASAFWQCFFATCLPDTTDYTNLKIVCLDVDGVNRTHELKKYIHRFENEWIPKD